MDSSLYRFRLSQQPLTPDPPPPSQGKGEESADNRNPIPQKRTISCQRCRKLKKKCSKTYPSCTLCTHAQVKCSFLEASKISSVSISDVQELQARVAWLSRVVNNILPLDSPVESFATGSDLPVATSPSYDGPSPAITNEDLNPDAPHSLRLGNQILNIQGQGEHSLQTTAFSGGIPISNLLDELGSTTTNAAASISYPGSTTLNLLSGRRGSVTIPEEAAGRQFVDAYFRHIHRAYPFMDRAQVMKDVNMMGDLLTDRVDNMSTNLYIVMAIGCKYILALSRVAFVLSTY